MLVKRQQATKNDDGVTLVELLILIVILGVLAGIVVFGIAQFRHDSTATACKADKKTVEVAAEAYADRTGKYPDDITDLTTGKEFLAKVPAGKWSFDPSTKKVTRTPPC